MEIKKIILFDIDYTLFNTDLFRDKTYNRLMALLKQEDVPTYHQKVVEVEKMLIKKGGYEPVQFAKTLAKALEIEPNQEEIEELFYNHSLYDQCLYPEVKEVLEVFSKKEDTALGIVSQGIIPFQKRKISSIEYFFNKDLIYISEVKKTMIPQIISDLQGKESYIIDDSVIFLDAVKKATNETEVILIERENRYEERQKPENFMPTTTVYSLTDLLGFLDKIE